MIWFTSDTHFGHARIIELSNRPYRDVDEMNAKIANNWNKTVSPDDTVYHLGDVALGPLGQSLSVVKRLNGYKVLVVGNHDRIFLGNKPAYVQRFLPLYENVFDDIMEYGTERIFLRAGLESEGVLVSHFPYDGDHSDEDRFKEHRPVDAGETLLHGHTHSPTRVSRSRMGTLQLHVGVDAWGYTPVSADKLLRIINTTRAA